MGAKIGNLYNFIFTKPFITIFVNNHQLLKFLPVLKINRQQKLPIHQTYEEKGLLLRIAEGDERAFQHLVHLYTPLLASYILKLTKSREKAQEVVQDIFMQMWISRESLREVDNFRRYLFVASRNHALNAIRSMLREEKRRLKWLQDQPSLINNAPTQDYSPYVSIVEEAVQQLPEQQQKVWILCRIKGKKYHEAAMEMGLSRETVKKYLQYAQASITKHVRRQIVILLTGLLLEGRF